jgi:hypothetical protein
MAPPKGARAILQETALDDTTTLSKQKLAAQSHFAARGRRHGGNNSLASLTGSGLKELAAASAAAQMNPQPATATTGVRVSPRLPLMFGAPQLTMNATHRLTG